MIFRNICLSLINNIEAHSDVLNFFLSFFMFYLLWIKAKCSVINAGRLSAFNSHNYWDEENNALLFGGNMPGEQWGVKLTGQQCGVTTELCIMSSICQCSVIHCVELLYIYMKCIASHCNAVLYIWVKYSSIKHSVRQCITVQCTELSLLR